MSSAKELVVLIGAIAAVPPFIALVVGWAQNQSFVRGFNAARPIIGWSVFGLIEVAAIFLIIVVLIGEANDAGRREHEWLMLPVGLFLGGGALAAILVFGSGGFGWFGTGYLAVAFIGVLLLGVTNLQQGASQTGKSDPQARFSLDDIGQRVEQLQQDVATIKEMLRRAIPPT